VTRAPPCQPGAMGMRHIRIAAHTAWAVNVPCMPFPGDLVHAFVESFKAGLAGMIGLSTG
jgi:hypothetical protein